MSHQIDPKTSSDDDEWVYIDLADFGKAAAISKGDADGASGEDSCSDDVYSDYSGEGRLEKAYESDEDLDQVYNSHADAAEEEDGTSGEDAYSDNDCSDYSDEDLDQVTESESDHGAFDLLDQVTESESDHELDEYLEVEEFITNHITNHAKDTRKEKEVDGAAAPAADAVVDPAACATNEHFDDAAANDFSDYYYYDHGDYNVGAGGEHNVDGGLAYHDYYYSSYGRSSGYGYGGGDYFNGSFYGNGGGGGYFSGDFYGNGGGGGYYGGGYGYGGDGYRAGLHPRLPRLPYNPPGVGLFQPLPAASYELPYPYAASAQPSSQYGIVYIPRPASSPMAAAPPEPQP